MRSIRSFRERFEPVPRLVGALFVLGWCLMLGSACVTDNVALGDRAWDAGHPEMALNYYEKAIEEGSRDPQVYFKAARISQSQGALAQAERYFSQSLRYGGGVEVARALAEFYVQTNKFSQAIQVYQYLLRVDEDVQPIYSNIGTALMYAGKFLDAETYLLMAQQMRPTDPIPYINLGVLYDRHIRNPPRAVRFYECFLELKPNSVESRTVQTRLRELTGDLRVDTSRVELTCGESYRVEAPDRVDLSEVFRLEFGDSSGDADDAPIVIERRERTLTERPQEGEDTSVVSEEEALRLRAEQSFESGNYDRAVAKILQIQDERQSRSDRLLLSRAYGRMGRFAQAVEVGEALLEERPTPELVQWLLVLYDEVDAAEKKKQVCERFAGWPDYRESLAACAE